MGSRTTPPSAPWPDARRGGVISEVALGGGPGIVYFTEPGPDAGQLRLAAAVIWRGEPRRPGPLRRLRHRLGPSGLGLHSILVGLSVLVTAACTERVVGPEEEVPEQILFLSTREGGTDQLGRPVPDIYRMNVDGTGVENLTREPAHYEHLTLSPDGSRIAFTSDRAGGGYFGIWTMNIDGTDPVRLTHPGAGPRWSPDGSLIAFTTNREGRQQGIHVGLPDAYVMNADGSDPRNVSHSLGEELGFDVAVIGWSPDGQVVFETSDVVDGDVFRRVYVVNPDGTDLRPLFDRLGDHSPAWSPDGSRIAFISERDGRRALYVMNADGSAERPLTTHSGDDWLYGQFQSAPGIMGSPWSPDGTRIAFMHQWRIHTIQPDGQGLRILFDDSVLSFHGWSPDGTRILVTHRIIPEDVYVMNADGSGLRNLTNSSATDTDPVWLPPY